jgi:hypothetical protein
MAASAALLKITISWPLATKSGTWKLRTYFLDKALDNILLLKY